MRGIYEIGYRFFRMPWEGVPRAELVTLVESGRIQPCRAIDLGGGTGTNAIYLAQHGFDVTGVDYVSVAIAKARYRAANAGVSVSDVLDDLTNRQDVPGVFSFLVDYGTFGDLTPDGRDRYLTSLLAPSWVPAHHSRRDGRVALIAILTERGLAA
ncbi:MAG TPA: class I SAM-dependent methyltransferase [Ktedonobacterales bacterium]|nr:class I SAM-dependent methyltransferase [Ktedonobacterales bacterium]